MTQIHVPTQLADNDVDTFDIENFLAQTVHTKGPTCQKKTKALKEKIKSDRKIITKITIEQCIGEGGFGLVYKAHMEDADKKCAIKFILDTETSNNKPDRTLQEVNTLNIIGRLSKHVPQIYKTGSFVCDGYAIPYLVMELIPGPTLASSPQTLRLKNHWLHKDGMPKAKSNYRMNYSQEAMHWFYVLSIFEQLAQTLKTMHHAGIYHLDIKPGNIKINENNSELHAVILDFGISSLKADEQVCGLGTPGYMGPRQCQFDAVPGPDMDIWSLGAVMWELLTGKTCYKQTFFRPNSLISGQAHITPARQLNPSVLPQIDKIVMEIFNSKGQIDLEYVLSALGDAFRIRRALLLDINSGSKWTIRASRVIGYKDTNSTISFRRSGSPTRNKELHINKSEFSAVDFSIKDLSGLNLDGLDLSYSNLMGVTLKNSSLVGADLQGAMLSFANLENTDLTGANLKYACLISTVMTGACFVGADFKSAVLQHCNAENANFTSAKLHGTVANNTCFRNSNLTNTDFKNSITICADFRGSDIDKAIWKDSFWLVSMIARVGAHYDEGKFPKSIFKKVELWWFFVFTVLYMPYMMFFMSCVFSPLHLLGLGALLKETTLFSDFLSLCMFLVLMGGFCLYVWFIFTAPKILSSLLDIMMINSRLIEDR